MLQSTPVTPDLTGDPIGRHDQDSVRRGSSWDIRNAPKNYASLVASHGATAIFSFASTWLITQKLGSEVFGSIIALVAASQLVQIFLNWSSPSLARFGLEEFVQTGEISQSFWSRFLLFIPNLILVLILSTVWLEPLAGAFSLPQEIVWLVVGHLIATSVWLHVQLSLQGVKMLRLQGFLLAVERVLTFLALSFLWLTDTLTLTGACLSYIAPATVLSIAGAIILRRYVSFKHIFDRVQLRRMLLFSLPLIPFAIVGYLSTSQMDAFFISTYLSIQELGIYSIATQVNGILLQFPILANSILLSLFVSLGATGADSRIHEYFQNTLPTLTLTWAIACTFLALGFWITIPFVFGVEFSKASEAFWLLTTASVMGFPILMGYASLTHSLSKTHVSMFSSLAAALTNLGLNLLLIPRFGLLGCATATILSGLTGMLVFHYYLLRSGHVVSSWLIRSLMPSLVGSVLILAGQGLLVSFAAFIVMFGLVYLSKAAEIGNSIQFVQRKLGFA